MISNPKKKDCYLVPSIDQFIMKCFRDYEIETVQIKILHLASLFIAFWIVGILGAGDDYILM